MSGVLHGIPNDRLRPEDLPAADADWGTLGRFALTFNAYDHWGSFDACAEVALEKRHSTLSELRTCLFYEQRRWRHSGFEPYDEHLEYIREVVEKIRAKVAAGETE